MFTCIASLQAGAIEVLQAIMDTGVENVATDRAKFIFTWLTVGADQDDFKAPQGEKTFEGKTFRMSNVLGPDYNMCCVICKHVCHCYLWGCVNCANDDCFGLSQDHHHYIGNEVLLPFCTV